MTRTIVLALAVLALLPAAAGAKKNPYTPTGVCGAGFKVIGHHQLRDTRLGDNRLLSVVYLTYNSASGQNCVVNMKRWRVGIAGKNIDDLMSAELYTRPLKVPGNVQSNQGNFKYYAGPVYVSARHKCVQWGGEDTMLVPANWHPRGYYESAFRSGWVHCR